LGSVAFMVEGNGKAPISKRVQWSSEEAFDRTFQSVVAVTF